jgi:hypothetical protein
VLLELRGFLRDAFRRPRHEKVPLTKTRSKASMTCPTTLIARAALGLAVVAAHAAAQAPAFSGDPQKGAQKVAMCQGCHGIPGWRTANSPTSRLRTTSAPITRSSRNSGTASTERIPSRNRRSRNR